ncbi:RWD domain-containing protein 4-like isoform X2 [Styela clava]|uniref:RWD domain-containing protein 4-like isoform X2 n=1 Tax=Styela clava TaxID=7725 RepID=UPI00193ADA8B|nr:RWD domain-containing protein 4-like isoform X2 [Styela clava]
MELSEQQEEVEVLNSIFEGDEAFTQISDTEFQYKVGEDGSMKSFLITIKWPEQYPQIKPDINMDSFYNKHITEDVKQSIMESATEQAELLIGEAATYTIIDWAKENAELLMAEQREVVTREEGIRNSGENAVSKKKEKKEQLTKAQKRKLADRLNASGERARGWNWVDVVKHLSQTGRTES